MSHEDHGWTKTSFEDENNNRYQAGAPLVVLCGRCSRILAADDEWARFAAGGDDAIEKMLLAKIHKWDDKNIVIDRVIRDPRGRIELEWKEGS